MLKSLIFFTILLLVVFCSHAQIKAVTDTGDEVLLFSDGTWRYKQEIKNVDSIINSKKILTKDAAATFLLKSKISNVGVWLDAKKWNFEKAANEAFEYSFSLKENGSAGGMIVIESLGIDLTQLAKIAMQNIESVSKSFKVLNKEYRTVNNCKVLYMEIEAVVEGIKLLYYNYYYTDETTSVQFICYVPLSIKKFSKEIETFMNGFVVLSAKEEAALQNDNGLSASSLNANSDCRKFLKGNWSYTANGKKYIDKFLADKVFETNVVDKATSEYSFAWKTNCQYVLKLLKTNDRAFDLIDKAKPMLVDVLLIDQEKMQYSLSVESRSIHGEMTKEKD